MAAHAQVRQGDRLGLVPLIIDEADPVDLLRACTISVGKNFGVAIILLTVIVRGLMFPVAQKQFGSDGGR